MDKEEHQKEIINDIKKFFTADELREIADRMDRE